MSFSGALGFDGLVQATALTMLHPDDAGSIYGVYLLPLRHPVPVARQLADIESARTGAARARGRGGRRGPSRSIESAGSTRPPAGQRMDECLTIARPALIGAPTTVHGKFFDVDDAVIAPPDDGVPILVGGRSDVAVRRAGRLGDGWLGVWNSPRRFAAAEEMAAQEAARAGRPDPPTRHAMQVWCGFADTREAARACLAPAMEAMYQLPFERFERYCPYGTPDDVAGFLAPYVEAGLHGVQPDPAVTRHRDRGRRRRGGEATARRGDD